MRPTIRHIREVFEAAATTSTARVKVRDIPATVVWGVVSVICLVGGIWLDTMVPGVGTLLGGFAFVIGLNLAIGAVNEE